MEWARKEGWQVGVVERFNHHAGIRQDLYGCIDVLACAPGRGILGISVSSKSDVSAHIKKHSGEPRLHVWLESGGMFEVWSFRQQKNGRYVRRIVRFSPDGSTEEEKCLAG